VSIQRTAAAALQGRFARKLQRRASEPIAIVGMGCRFCMSPNVEAYRRLLARGALAIGEIPGDRWDIGEYYSPVPGVPGTMNTRYGGFLDRVDLFDAGLFRLSPREAEAMDPQHRLLLEVAWEALEHAGMSLDAISGSQTGVYIGIASFDYLLRADRSAVDGYTHAGAVHSAAAGRLSYFFNLKGPSEAIDTACSGSLAALHRACQSLRTHEIDCALAGGVNVMLDPSGHIGFSQAGMMAPDGRCKTFDARADGYVRSEGCGLVILKRLADAERDRDMIHALITSSAVNHDGRSQGFTAPSGLAQQDVVQRALKLGGLGPEEVDCVEVHGTGTALGDPQELYALGAVLQGRREGAHRRVVVSSAKTNVGHLEAAAGMAGLIKLVLMIRDGEVFPHINLDRVNPNIDLASLPFEIPTQRRPWRRQGDRRVGGVSSFGFSGTNAHVIVESAPDAEGANEDTGEALERAVHLLALSARSRPALQALAGRWRRHLQENVSDSLADLSFTANVGRTHADHRLAVVAESRAQAWDALRDAGAGGGGRVFHGEPGAQASPKVAFLFTGQGAQHAGMGQRLYEAEPAFREALDACAEGLKPHMTKPLLEVMFAPRGDRTIDEAQYAQPALFALEYSLFRLWERWGVRPFAVLGHSVGEYAAACAAGVFDLADALALVAARGRLMQALPRAGAMVAVQAGEDQVRNAAAPYGARVSIAAVDGPQSTVLAGEREAVAAATEVLRAAGVRTRELSVSHAFHSALLDPMLDELERAARAAHCRAPQCHLASNLTGALFAPGQVPDAAYWRRHAREPVLFEAGVRALSAAGATVFIELGPHPVLTSMARQFLDGPHAWVASLREDRDDLRQVLESVAELYVRGAAIDWRGFHAGHAGRKASAPTYPFERKRYWIERSRVRDATVEQQGCMDLVQQLAEAPPADRRRLLMSFITEQVADIMGVKAATLDGSRIYSELGMSSPGSVELLNRLQKSLRCELQSLIVDRQSTETLAEYLLPLVLGPDVAERKDI
jgi:acyl transferase domain-containing protein